ncbi:MAG TPA: hypothetical protein VGF40_06190, partial [Thermoanaerobaculia bacterium]
ATSRIRPSARSPGSADPRRAWIATWAGPPEAAVRRAGAAAARPRRSAARIRSRLPPRGTRRSRRSRTWASIPAAARAGNGPTTYLVDEENGTKYYALTDKEGHVLATMHEYVNGKYGINETVKPGTTKRYWAKFPAPPPAVKTITVLFSDAEPIEDVPIADK